MAIPSMKEYVLSIIRPLIVALKVFYNNQVQLIFDRMKVQNESFSSLQQQVAELSKLVVKLQTTNLEIHQKLVNLEKNLYSSQELRAITRRCNELDYISGILFDLVYRFQATGNIPDVVLPDFECPIVPEEPGLSEEELEIAFREYEEIPIDAELTDEQKTKLAKYISAYYKKYPKEEDTDENTP